MLLLGATSCARCWVKMKMVVLDRPVAPLWTRFHTFLDCGMGYEVQDSVFHGEFAEWIKKMRWWTHRRSSHTMVCHSRKNMISLHIGCCPCSTLFANVVSVLATSCCAHIKATLWTPWIATGHLLLNGLRGVRSSCSCQIRGNDSTCTHEEWEKLPNKGLIKRKRKKRFR